MSAQQKLDRLTKWLDDNNIKWDKDALSIKEQDGSFGIFALKDMKKSDTIVKIPKEVILSTKTCGIANILDEANLEGGCPLALAVLYEIAQKEDSPWYGYLQALPDQGEDLPMFWEEEEKEWFRGTEMESPVYNDFNDLEDDYHELIEPLLEAYPYIFKRKDEEDPYSFDKFVKASTLISSRAFEVDAFHETALVPFADLFNHRGQGEHVHFETEFQVCEACGVLEFCEHQYFNYLEENDDEKEEGEEGQWEDEEDVEEGDEEEPDTELPDLEELEQKNVDFWDKEEEDEEKDCCDMVLDRDVQKGKEIFNTYGDHPNIALLSKYGFCYDNNKNDYVSIGENSIVDCCLAITLEILKAKHPKASKEELEMMAVEETRPRWELFLRHEHILCPTQGDDLEEGPDDFEDGCEEDCCGGGDHDHDHEGEGHEHAHDEDGGCCGGEEDEEEEGPSRPYFINSEGLFEDKVMCLLHIMFVSEAKLKKFTENIDNALEYFDELANSQGQVTKSLLDVKRKVYQACHALADFRRMEYFDDDGEWKSVEKDIEERKEIPEGSRKYYAMTLRISEKKIIDKAVKYYDEMVKGCSVPSAASSSSNKKQKRPNRSRK